MTTATLPPPDAAFAVTPRITRPRVTGIDLARGIAMLGMLAAHVGPAAGDGTPVGALMTAAHGRSSILFATLAGVSLALMSGGSRPPLAGEGRGKQVRRIATRAVLILALGTLLVALGTPVMVILAYYGVFFLFALPFLWLRARTLFVLAGLLAVVAPITSMLLQSWQPVQSGLEQIDRFEPLALLSGEGLTQLILTGTYPAWTWMPFLFVGIGLGRLGVDRLRLIPLASIGAALMLLAYGGSAVLTTLFPSAGFGGKGFGSFPGSLSGSFPDKNGMDAIGSLPLGQGRLVSYAAQEFDPTFLLGAEEHTSTPFEIIGGIGTALLVLAASLWLARRFPRLTWPIVAVGTMSLTVYTGHVIAINLVGLSAFPGEPIWVLLAFATVAALFATVWLRFFRRGPLEHLMHVAVTRAPWTR